MAIERGMFWCPREAKKRRFRLRSARRWIRVGSLAAIRLPSRGNYYECASCHSTCEVGTLHSMAGSEEDGAGAAEDVVTTLVRYLTKVVTTSSAAPARSSPEPAVLCSVPTSHVE